MDNINLFHRNFFAMNTRFEVVSYGKDGEIFVKIFDKIERVVKDLEKVISCYNETSEVFRINHEQPVKFCDISEELSGILDLSEQYKQKTNSCFDYCFDHGRVYGKKTHCKRPDIEKVKLDFITQKFRFTETGFALDFGAIGKGLTLERVAAILSENGVTNCFISFGDSSILTRGKHPHGPHWPFSLANIDDSKFQLNDATVSTSGTLQPDGNYHIIDPRNNQKITKRKLISVKSSSAIESEVLSTALLVAKENEQKEILNNFSNYEIITIDYKDKPKIRKFYD